MRKTLIPAVFLFAATALAAPGLFTGATETKWSVKKNGAAAGTITLLTSANASRAEFRGTAAKAPVAILLGGNGKVWVRHSGGDTELATISAMTPEYTTAPALLLPFADGGKVETKDGKPASYAYRGVKATYQHDANGASAVEIKAPDATWTLTRTSFGKSTADASNFAIRPAKSTGSRLARLSGDLLGPSQSSVSATAGGRGAGTKGLKLADGGDYAAVEAVENRDANWRGALDESLAEFQKAGKVGKEREQ